MCRTRGALWVALTGEQIGRVYQHRGGSSGGSEVVRTILRLLGKPESLIRFVADRPGHDRRYAMMSPAYRPNWIGSAAVVSKRLARDRRVVRDSRRWWTRG